MPDEIKRTEQRDSETLPLDAAANENESLAPPSTDKAAIEAAVQELRDKYLRAVAETENVRKRAEREVAEARAYGIAVFARDMLGVADNLARALEAIDPQERTAAEGPLKALLDGVDLTQRELQKTLQKHGIRRLDPLGEKFDPHFHQAMIEVPDAEAPAGTVVEVMQAGYAIGERVLRPAMVAVAKGGPKATSEDGRLETPSSNVEGLA
jgi:molecular chaperone GrpE